MSESHLETQQVIAALLDLIRKKSTQPTMTDQQKQLLVAAYRKLKQGSDSQKVTRKQIKEIARKIKKASTLNSSMIHSLLDLCEHISELIHSTQLALSAGTGLPLEAWQIYKNLLNSSTPQAQPSNNRTLFLQAVQQASVPLLEPLEQVQHLVNQMMIKMQLHELASQELDAASELARLAAPIQDPGEENSAAPTAGSLAGTVQENQSLADRLYVQHRKGN